MTDARLDRMEKMMEQLVGMVANNTSQIDGIRKDLSIVKDDVAILKDDVAVLKDDVAILKDDVAILKDDVSTLKVDVIRLEDKIDNIHKHQQEDIIAMLVRTATKDDIAKIAATQQLHTDWLRKLSADSVQHELEINQLKIAR